MNKLATADRLADTCRSEGVASKHCREKLRCMMIQVGDVPLCIAQTIFPWLARSFYDQTMTGPTTAKICSWSDRDRWRSPSHPSTARAVAEGALAVAHDVKRYPANPVDKAFEDTQRDRGH